MSTLFISCMYSEVDKDLFLRNSKRGYQYASQNLQEAIIDGLLSNNEDLTVITIPSLSTFPFGNKLLTIKDKPFVYQGNEYGKSFGFLNVLFLKKVSKRKIDVAIRHWTKHSSAPRKVIVYGMHPRLMSIAAMVKKKDVNTKSCIIIPDLPEFMGYNKILAKFGFREKAIEKAYSLLDIFDSYTLLAKGMLDKLPVKRPNIIVEGIYRGEIVAQNDAPKGFEKIIMYSGGLHARYGIVDLIQAFALIPDVNYRLWVCGTGDAISIIKECSERDNRIQYLGSLPSEKVRELQRCATLLVNPRHSNEEFTRYSFPSKTIEYLASGTPVLMSHLPCIPAEYDDYLFYFNDESVNGMKESIIKVCSLDKAELQERGLRAQAFVKEQKVPKNQIKRVLELLSSLE